MSQRSWAELRAATRPHRNHLVLAHTTSQNAELTELGQCLHHRREEVAALGQGPSMVIPSGPLSLVDDKPACGYPGFQHLGGRTVGLVLLFRESAAQQARPGRCRDKVPGGKAGPCHWLFFHIADVELLFSHEAEGWLLQEAILIVGNLILPHVLRRPLLRTEPTAAPVLRLSPPASHEPTAAPIPTAIRRPEPKSKAPPVSGHLSSSSTARCSSASSSPSREPQPAEDLARPGPP
mmetsp:Transcript_114132/g.362840  ORF Transcript_114132/g.362840 Transcript_114132/m.362840 type:complete len:236 (+) Transcript_114132:25-732(+)